MRFKHQRQHRKKPEPEFYERRDRFNNITVIARWQGQEFYMTTVDELALPKAKKQLAKLLR